MRSPGNDRDCGIRLPRRDQPDDYRGSSGRTEPRPTLKRAVVLLSGGLDSATALAICRADGFEAYALSFRYGQRHEREVPAGCKIAKSLGAKEHRIARIDLRVFSGSALTAELEVPKTRSATEMASGIPVTYVPARNTIFLSYAL